jgi:hypothetical protein
MVKVLHDTYEKAYIIKGDDFKDSGSLITIGKVKEVTNAISVLHNNPNIVITVYSGCIDVEPMENIKSLKIDPVIFRGNKVTKLNTFSFNVMIGQHEYKTKKINDNFSFDGDIIYTNCLEKVVIHYFNRNAEI